MKLCSYVVHYDHGFAPNPYGKYLTLACCMERMRVKREKGDWIVGTSSKTRHGTGTRLVFAMKVTDVITFDQYCQNSQYSTKIPQYGLIEQRGDNIYYRDDGGKMRQRVPSYHSHGMKHVPLGHGQDRWEISPPWKEHEEKKAKDLSGRYVLVSEPGEFWYYGGTMELPEGLLWIIRGRQGFTSNFTDEQERNFVDWVTGMPSGRHGDPIDLDRTPLIPPEDWRAS